MTTSQINPVVVRIVDPPSTDTSVADVLIGAVGFVGAVTIAALVVGLLAGAAFILFRKLREQSDDGQNASTGSITR